MPAGYVYFLVMPLAGLASAPQPQSPPVVVLPTVVVTAQKEPADAQRLPVSVTAVTVESIQGAGIDTVADAAVLSPNTRVVELSARKISNAFVRGIGSSPSNPGVTTYIDGIPQLSSNSSSVELLDIERIEFVRGPQGALFGRNTLGGLVSVSSARPSLNGWTGRVAVPFGSDSARALHASVSGPVSGSLAVGASYSHGRRDGFTTNDLTGHALDSRSADAAKVQLLWVPSAAWETRFIAFGERARDGDYALNDLDQVRRNPFHVMRDFEGRTDRDVWSGTFLLRREGRRVAFSSATGYVSWMTRDITDLDYSPLPLITRDNTEDDRQFTQELRLASAVGAPARLSDAITVAWQAGLVLFAQRYAQDAVNLFAPQVLSPLLPVPVSQHSPQSDLDNGGLGVYGQGTLTVEGSLDLVLGARFDRERKNALLNTYYVPAVAPPNVVDAGQTFSDVSPQAALAWRVPNRTAYVSVGRGFKAGGFNPASPPGSEAYGQEHAWNVEGGLKTTWAEGRLSVNGAVFRIAWDDMQLNVPSPVVPGQFYIANVGGAHSSGAEIELNARPRAGFDLFSSMGITRGRFANGSASGGLDVSGNDLPNTPRYTVSFGTQVLAGARFSGGAGRPRRRRVDRRVSLRRVQPGGPGGLLARPPSRRRAGPSRLDGGMGQERLRHPLCPRRVRVREPGAVRFPRRAGPSAHVRHQCRLRVLARDPRQSKVSERGYRFRLKRFASA